MSNKVTTGADVTGQYLNTVPFVDQLAGYSTGSGGVPWSAAQWAQFPGALRIDQDPAASDRTADYLDVEKGAATLDDCAPWSQGAWHNWHNATRPGQRTPAIYMSRNNVTNVVNALIAGGVTSGVGLVVADWNLTRAQAISEVEAASGPFPIVGIQYANLATYDLDVWSTAWLNNVSGASSP